MKIYELVHMHGAETLADGRFHYGDCAMLGCFSSAERVAAAIEKYRSIPGFCDYPNGFVVFAHEVEEHAVLVYLANVYIHDAEYVHKHWQTRTAEYPTPLRGQPAQRPQQD